MSTSTDKPAVERIHPPGWLMRVVNPVVTQLIKRGVPTSIAERLMILHFTGHKSGRRYDIPVGYRRIDGRMGVLSNSPWRVNFRGGRDIEVTLETKRRPAHASITEDVDEVAAIYESQIAHFGHEQAGRHLGLRINVDRPPTRDELRDLVRSVGLTVIWIDLRD